jgi:hypothetical protein
LEEQAREAKELLADGTRQFSFFLVVSKNRVNAEGPLIADGTTQGGWELTTVLAEDSLHSYPIALLLHRPSADRRGKKTTKAGKSSRVKLMREFFSAVRERCGSQPSIFHIDKDFAEVSALEQVWPSTKIQTCLWHLKKAITRRLRTAANAQRVSYSAAEVARFLPKVDRKFLPINAVAPKRTTRHPAPVPRNPLPSSLHTPHAPTSSSTTPRIVLSRKSEAYLRSDHAPSFSPNLLAEMCRRDDDDDGDDDDDDVEEDGRAAIEEEDDRGAGDGREEGVVEAVEDEDDDGGADGRSVKKKRKVGGKGGMHGEVSQAKIEEKRDANAFRQMQKRSLAGSETTLNKLLHLVEAHFCAHTSIPSPGGRLRSAEDIYRESLEEMYDFCFNNKLVDAWVYFWNSWYRPGRWHLWARSTYHEIPVYRTTMGAEAFFGRLKNEFLGKSGRGTLVDLLEVIDRAVIPWSVPSSSRKKEKTLTHLFLAGSSSTLTTSKTLERPSTSSVSSQRGAETSRRRFVASTALNGVVVKPSRRRTPSRWVGELSTSFKGQLRAEKALFATLPCSPRSGAPMPFTLSSKTLLPLIPSIPLSTALAPVLPSYTPASSSVSTPCSLLALTSSTTAPPPTNFSTSTLLSGNAPHHSGWFPRAS